MGSLCGCVPGVAGPEPRRCPPPSARGWLGWTAPRVRATSPEHTPVLSLPLSRPTYWGQTLALAGPQARGSPAMGLLLPESLRTEDRQGGPLPREAGGLTALPTPAPGLHRSQLRCQRPPQGWTLLVQQAGAGGSPPTAQLREASGPAPGSALPSRVGGSGDGGRRARRLKGWVLVGARRAVSCCVPRRPQGLTPAACPNSAKAWGMGNCASATFLPGPVRPLGTGTRKALLLPLVGGAQTGGAVAQPRKGGVPKALHLGY